jgi:hypothetical protein
MPDTIPDKFHFIIPIEQGAVMCIAPEPQINHITINKWLQVVINTRAVVFITVFVRLIGGKKDICFIAIPSVFNHIPKP